MANHEGVDQAVAEGGAYEVIRARLNEQASRLKQKTDDLNSARVAEFGQPVMDVLARVRVRTENNCIARDIVPVGDKLLFGYNVFIGLKKETKIQDVFSLFELIQTESSYELQETSQNGTFLADAKFQKDFAELYIYYKESKLIQLKVQNQILFAVFQIGRKISDIRVFQWLLNKDGSAKYIDNRGERAIKAAASHDFEWTKTSHDQYITGTHSHINILDKIFVETIKGNLTIKVENNTENGLGIYSEPVDDKTQSLSDADIQYAEVGSLILLKIQPYREKEYRYLVFNTRTQKVNRIDAIGSACQSLPEDHGIIFPGGYYLQNGETKSFPDEIEGLTFKRSIRSPNGEDVLYVFYEPESGICGLYSYNLIRKSLLNPIYCHGYSIFDNGKSVFFNAEEEATRIHPMQIWETPFFSEEFAAKQPTGDTFYSRIGNKELVRGISDMTSICRMIANPAPSRSLYEDLIKASKTLFDTYYWLTESEVNGIADVVKEVSTTSELVIDEFDKVEQIRSQAKKALVEAQDKQKAILQSIKIKSWDSPEQYVGCLTQLRNQRGHLITLREQRYIDLDALTELDEDVAKNYDKVSQATVQFLAGDSALKPYNDKVGELEKQIAKTELVVDIAPINESLEQLSQGLDLLTEILNSLKVEDATVRTKIIDDISEIYSKLNQVKAKGRQKRKQLGSGEASAEFAAQFRLFSQSINSALAMADTPEKADEELSRLMIQLEELESKFSEFDQYLDDIMTKREELHTAFESRKQALLEDRQRRAQNLFSAAERILKGINRRASTFADTDQLNSYFAADPMVLKIADLVTDLRDMDDQVKADDLEAQIKAAKEQAIRSLRDKLDIFEDGGNIIKFGKHKFSVNSQALELTLLPKDDGLYRHLAGTDYFEKIEHEQLSLLKPYWQQPLVSENDNVSRCEYLSYVILEDAEQQRNDLSLKSLYAMQNDPAAIKKLVQKYVSARYQEGYEKGIHDADTSALLLKLLPVHQYADLLRFSPSSRALAILFWSFAGIDQQTKTIWHSHAISAQALSITLNSRKGFATLLDNLTSALNAFSLRFGLPFSDIDVNNAAEYLAAELSTERASTARASAANSSNPKLAFLISKSGRQLAENLLKQLQQMNQLKAWKSAIEQLQSLLESNKTEAKYENQTEPKENGLIEQWQLANAWLSALLEKQPSQQSAQQFLHYIPEAAALLLAGTRIKQRSNEVDLGITVEDMLSEHRRIEDGKLTLSLDEYNQRLSVFSHHDIVNFNKYHKLRRAVMAESQAQLQLEQFAAKPLSSFVRNKLINEVYLPLVGDNLAKQMGTVGEDKRTDLMGMLLLISPPGYGKTTLMEYIADRLGLVFMKINCPSLGHDVASLDPSTAPNATARQELEKLNLGLEMGNNVMLYLDDIQHTHPEFLQKFISLCDGTRRIEGIWQGQSKTYDMRGKKFCVVMAGNPYTESGDMFKIPDMLANRADIYNLGDVLNGKEHVFALSYIENCLTSNKVLAPLALRDMSDVYKFVDMAQGKEVASSDLSHQYSGAEINEICSVLKHLFTIQEVILKVNLEYIKSAAIAEDYRQEPPFKLQGSYRNMNKMAEKVSAVMNHDELMQLIGDHYQGEAQTLTSGAEENLLKLAMLRGVMTDDDNVRWQHICKSFESKKNIEIEGDPTQQAAQQLTQMTQILDVMKDDMLQSDTKDLIKPINRVAAAMYLMSKVWKGEKTDVRLDDITHPKNAKGEPKEF